MPGAGGQLAQSPLGLGCLRCGGRVAEQFGQLVEQRHILHGPVGLAKVRTGQRLGSPGVQADHPYGVGEPRQHLRRCQRGPPCLQESAELAAITDVFGEPVPVEMRAIQPGPQRVQQDRGGSRACGVGHGSGRFAPGAYATACIRQVVRSEREHLSLVHESQPIRRRRQRLPHQLDQHVPHATPAFDLGDLRRVAAFGGHPHDEFAERAKVHAGGGRPPVDQEWFQTVTDAQPPDVVRLAVVEVEPAEHEALRFGVKRPQLRGGAVDHRVTLHQSGDRAGRCPPVTLASERIRLRSHPFEPLVDPVDDLLLGGDLLRSDVGHSAPPVSASLGPP